MKSLETSMEASDIYINEKINKRVEREISHLGKEKLIIDHINHLAAKSTSTNANRMLFLLIRLYSLNKQIHDSLTREMLNDKKLLSKRIKSRIKDENVHREIYKKLLYIASKHYKAVSEYAKRFNSKKKHTKDEIMDVVQHKRRAEMIYKALINAKIRNTLHKVLLIKLGRVYNSILSFTLDLSEHIPRIAKEIKENDLANVKKASERIDDIINAKIEILREFAYKYTYNILHSQEFLDFDSNKVILMSRKI